MAMSNRIRRELNKARELVWLYVATQKCFFCKKPFLPDGLPEYIRFGDCLTPPLPQEILDITEHHKDEDHENNDPRNLALAHQNCHKSHHAKKVFRAYLNGAEGSQGRAVPA